MLPFRDNGVGNSILNGSPDKTRIASCSAFLAQRYRQPVSISIASSPAPPLVPRASVHGESHLFIIIEFCPTRCTGLRTEAQLSVWAGRTCDPAGTSIQTINSLCKLIITHQLGHVCHAVKINLNPLIFFCNPTPTPTQILSWCLRKQ